MTVDLRSWWNALDPYWTRVFKIMIDREHEHNRAKRDAFVPTDQDLINLTALRDVSIFNASVSNLKPLTRFTKAESMTLNLLQRLTSLEGLQQLPTLKALSLIGLPVSDFSIVAQLKQLERLTLETGIKSLEPVKSLTQLKHLSLHENVLENLAGLEQLQSLEELTIHKANFKDFTPIAALKNLKKLHISYSNITSIQAITSLPSLTELSVVHSPIDSLAGMEQLQNLERLDINSTNVADLSPLKTLKKLNVLIITKTRVSDLAPLLGLPLQSLQISDSIISGEMARSFEVAKPACNIITEKPYLPFRKYHHYRVIQEGVETRGQHPFVLGQELAFVGSDYNHYDGIEICYFKDLKTGISLRWDCYSQALDSWSDHFEKIEFKQ
jgi:Leucine-rich repeat (LRR) protein